MKQILLTIILGFIPEFFLAQSLDSLELLLDQSQGKSRVDLLNQLHQQYKVEDPLKALIYTTEALKISETILYPEGLVTSTSNLGVYYRNLGDLEKSVSFLKKVVQLQEKSASSASLAIGLNDLGITYGMMGDFESALESYSQTEMKDSLYEIESSQKIARLKVLYELDEERLKDLDHNVIELQDENKKIEIILVLLVAIVLLAAFIGVYRNLLGKKKR